MKHTRAILFTYTILLLIILLAYSNSILNGFVYDDASVVSNNPRIHTIANIRHLLTEQYFAIVDIGKETAYGEASYRPVVTLSYFIDAMLWNAQHWGCHITNIMLHIGVAFLLFTIFRYLLQTLSSAFVGTLLFSMHPLLTEAVNGIAFREDILATLFCLAGFYCFIKKPFLHSRFAKGAFDACHGLLYFGGLLSKEMALSYPLIFFLLSYSKKIPLKKNIGLIVILAGITLCYFIIRFSILVNPEKTVHLYPGGTVITNICTMITVIWIYIKKLFFPVMLLVDYTIKPCYSFLSFAIIGTILIIILSLLIAVKSRKTAVGLGVLWFYAALLPVSNLIPLSNIAAERYLYFPLIGAALIGGILFTIFFSFNSRWSIVSLTAIILCYCIIICMRNADWKNSITLWKSTIRVEPKSARAYSNLGTDYFEQKHYKKALKCYLKCISLRNSSQDNYNLGNCYRKIGDFERAVQSYRAAIAIDPTFPEYYENLALSYIELGMYADSEAAFQKAIGYGRLDDTLYENMGLLYDSMKNYDKALRLYKKSLELNPNRPTAINKIALIYIKTGNTEKGIKLLLEGVDKYPQFVIFYKNLGTWHELQKQWSEAIFYWEKAYSLTPEDSGIILKLIKLCALADDENKRLFYHNKYVEGSYE